MDLRLHALGPNYQGKQSLAVFQTEGRKREAGRVGNKERMESEKKQSFNTAPLLITHEDSLFGHQLFSSFFFLFFWKKFLFKARGVKHWVLGYANVTLSSLLQASKCYGETL